MTPQFDDRPSIGYGWNPIALLVTTFFSLLKHPKNKSEIESFPAFARKYIP
jgi:hypothetical protein